MAVRIQNTAEINFGNAGAAVTITHWRIRKGTVNLVLRGVATSRTLAVGQPMKVEAGEIDVVFPKGQCEDAGIQDAWNNWFTGGGGVLIDLMTSDANVVAVSGYSQQTVAAFTLSIEND